MYEQTTYLLGFCNPRIFLADAGKTMGLAAWGRPHPELEEPWVQVDGFKLDFSGFRSWMKSRGFDREVLVRTRGLATGNDDIDPYAMDVAYKVQAELEKGVLGLAEELRRQTGARNLCFAGGVALNSVANGLLLRRRIFDEVFIQPASHDGGQALGLACHGHLMLTRESVAAGRPSLIRPLRHAYGGRPYAAEELEALLTASGLEHTRLADDEALARDAAGEIGRSRIVGWFQGGSEIGPRALGHRSILADPSVPGMKDQVNARVKLRERFRPFAPSVLAERASEVFDLEGESPYMLVVVPIREEWKDRVPAVAHCDGTARIQTVDADVEPLFHRLISAFEERTGIPLVLNTSFNLQGMPIVETPTDALRCFLSTDLDGFYLGPFKVSRPDLDALVPAWHDEWEFSIVNELNGGGPVLEARHEGGSRSSTLPLTPAMARVLRRFDGHTTLGDARRSVAAKDREPTEEAVLTLARRLLRGGVLELRVGRLSFRDPGEGRHWWQLPRTRRARLAFTNGARGPGSP